MLQPSLAGLSECVEATWDSPSWAIFRQSRPNSSFLASLVGYDGVSVRLGGRERGRRKNGMRDL